jgi:hypothetical protein
MCISTSTLSQGIFVMTTLPVTKPEKILAGAKHASQTPNLPSQDNNDENL